MQSEYNIVADTVHSHTNKGSFRTLGLHKVTELCKKTDSKYQHAAIFIMHYQSTPNLSSVYTFPFSVKYPSRLYFRHNSLPILQRAKNIPYQKL